MARSIFGLIIGLIFVVCLAGASYEAIVAYTDARRFPEPGRLIDIGGFHLSICGPGPANWNASASARNRHAAPVTYKRSLW